MRDDGITTDSSSEDESILGFRSTENNSEQSKPSKISSSSDRDKVKDSERSSNSSSYRSRFSNPSVKQKKPNMFEPPLEKYSF